LPTWASLRKSLRKPRSISATVTPALKPEWATAIDMKGRVPLNSAGA